MEQRRFHLLDVNLSTGRHELVDVTDQIRQFVGGRAYGAKLLWDHVPPGADPLSADNVLYVGIGPITGLLGSVTSLSAKSPLTLLRGVSHLNGHFGCELVYAGCHAGVLIRGAAAKPVYLCIDNGEVDIRDAGHLWGGTQLACQQALHAELKSRGEDQDFRFLSIGPAGENLVRNADVAHDLYHHAARSGMGTVMGAKRLKAIAVRGNRPPGYPDPGALYRLMRTMLLETREYQARFRRWGHTMSMARRYEATTEGVQNKMKGWDDTCTLFNPVILEQQYKVWSDSCSGCFVGCKVPYFQMPPPYGPVAGELRHDNAGGWSANALVAGYEPQAYLSAYVDHLGLDGEDVSGVVTWVMECYQKGLVTRDDLGGIDLTWGNLEAICALLKKIAYREGIGDALAEGLKFAPQKLGLGTKPYAMTRKGVAISSYEPRGSMKDALQLAVTAVGELHGGRGSPERIMYDSLTACSFHRREIARVFGRFSAWAAPMLNAACGWQLTEADVDLVVRRAAVMERCYSMREGYVPVRDDQLPDRFFEETLRNKYGEPKRLNRKEFLEKRTEVYRSYGLRDDGTPSRRMLEGLGLEFVIPEMPEAFS